MKRVSWKSRIKDQRIKDQGSRIKDQGSRIKDQGSRIKDQGSLNKLINTLNKIIKLIITNYELACLTTERLEQANSCSAKGCLLSQIVKSKRDDFPFSLINRLGFSITRCQTNK